MDRLLIRRAIIVFVGVFILVGIIVAIASIGGDPDPTTTNETEVAAVLGINEYDTTDSKITYSIDGAIVGRESHNSLRISITSHVRKIEIYDGYQGNTIAQKTYSNDLTAYRNFLEALQFEGFDLVREEADLESTEAGVCPTGRRYVAELFNNDRLIRRLWRASCSVRYGTLAGDNTAIKRLFIAQIPNDDYNELTRGLSLY